MADYSAKIKLIVDGLQSLKQVEDRVKNLNRLAAIDLGKTISGGKSFAAVKKEVDGVADSFSRLGKIVRGLAVGTGLGALTTSINSLSQAATALKFGGISKFAAALAAATGPAAGLFRELSGLAIQFPVVAGTATVAGAALLAFAPQVLRAGNATLRLAKAAAEAGQPLAQLMASLAGEGFRVDMFIDAQQAAEIYKNRLYELSETITTLAKRQATLQNTLNRFNSDSETAAKIATKLVDITRRLNIEQQAQNDLIRQAAGLRPESVENRATNTYNVVQRRKKFFQDQAQAAAEAVAQTRALEQAESDAARTRLAEAAKEKTNRLNEQAAAATQALNAIRSLETAESDAARARLRDAAERRKMLAGAQAYAYPIGPNPLSGRKISPFGEVSADKAEQALIAKEKRLLFQQEKAQLAEIDALRAANVQKEVQRFKGLGKAIKGSLSSAAIGGAFPLLFGQSPQAAVGGAIGGLLGGQAGGFAGSLLGTALGEISATQARIKELGAELGFTKTQAGELARAFELAGRNSDQLQGAIANIQGLGLSTKETASAIKISNELAEEYGGKVDKIAQAFANTLESGKVSISTLNSFTAQGIPIQEKLAEKLNVSRSTLLQMAKDGKISVQEVIDVLVDMGRQAETTASTAKTGFDSFTSSVQNLATVIAQAAGSILKNLVPALNTVLNRLALIIQQATTALSKLGDLQVGQAYAGISRAATNRGTFFGLGVSKKNIDDITQGLNTLQPATARNSAEIAKFRQVVEAAKIELGKYSGQIGEYAVATAQPKITQLQKQITARERQLPREPLTPQGITQITAPSQLEPSGGGAAGKTKTNAAEENLRRAQELLETLRRQNALAEVKNTLDLDILKISQNYEKTLDQIAELEDQSLRKSQEAQAVRLRNQEINNAVQEHEIKVNEELDKQVQKYMEIDAIRKTALEGYKNAEIVIMQDLTARAELLKFAFESIGQSFSNSVLQVTEGATTIQQAVADMFLAIGRSLFNYAAQAITTYIALGVARMFAGIPGVKPANYSGNEMGGIFNAPVFGVDSSGLSGPANPLSQLDYAGVKLRANGGPVSAGSPYIVGERGPELFVPGRSGTIVPNDQMGGSKVEVGSINISVENTGEALSAQAQKQIANQVQGIVMATLVNERRSGGVLR